VLDPWRASTIKGAQRALRRLAVAPDTRVALISGRTVPDLAARVRIGGISYRGDHGAERAEAPRRFRVRALHVERDAADAATVAMTQRLKREVPRLVPEPWLVVEDKGPAVTFHFRSAPDTDAARVRVRAAVDSIDADGLLDQPGGVRAWELRPHGASTKGDALWRLIEEFAPDAVLMLGDDRHDASAFDVLHAARDSGLIEGLAMAVASPAADTAEMARRADLVLADPAETARFLALLAKARAGPS
jgi:trehalose 6-phosphate phosphatase